MEWSGFPFGTVIRPFPKFFQPPIASPRHSAARHGPTLPKTTKGALCTFRMTVSNDLHFLSHRYRFPSMSAGLDISRPLQSSPAKIHPEQSQIFIRPAKSAHWPLLFGIQLEPGQSEFVPSPQKLWSSLAFQSCDQPFSIYGIWTDTRPVGLFTLQLSGTVAWLGGMQIDRRYQRRGLGTLVLSILKQKLNGSGITQLELNVHPRNEIALRFYEAWGFHPSPDQRTSPEIYLTLPLTGQKHEFTTASSTMAQ